MIATMLFVPVLCTVLVLIDAALRNTQQGS